MLITFIFGALFTLAVAYSLGGMCLRGRDAPPVIRLAVGAVVESGLVFGLLLAGWANRLVFSVVGAAALIALLRMPAARLKDPIRAPADRLTRRLAGAILSAYTVFYLVNALAPEVQPDGITYHLGLVAEYLRLGRFPDRIGFYEILPQGMEMLYAWAFAFGAHAAAKLVHFGFLLATLPLMLRIGRRLGLSDTASTLAVVAYYCAPVVGVSGTSSYTDAALAFFALATFYLLLIWQDSRDDSYLAPAGLTAGFCYAIKLTGVMMIPVALVFVLLSPRRRGALVLGTAAALAAAPWVLRAAILTGNPAAPLFNRWFPNPYFHALVERSLEATLGSYGGFSFARAPFELALGGNLQGMVGPLWLALPVGLVALRRRAGRLCWLAAAVLAIPWFWNVGARFLMPALAFAGLALAMVLPRRLAVGLMALQGVACWPAVIDRYETARTWQLREFPWRAALRIESEPNYLWRHLDELKIARMIEKDTRPGERIFALSSVATAYVDREVLEFWHSAQAEQLTDALKVAWSYRRDPFYDLEANWPPRTLRGMRFRLAQRHPGEWCIHEVRLFSGEDRVYNSPQWRLRAWPARWDAPLAFDDNLATRWRTWGSMLPGMYVEADFDRPQILSGAALVSHTPVYGVPVEFYGLEANGQWQRLAVESSGRRRTAEDLRRAAMQALRRAGFQYVLTPAGKEGNGPLGTAMARSENGWGLELAGQAGQVYLFRIP